MYALVRKTLEVYLREKKIIVLSDFPPELSVHMKTKESVFVTLYHSGKIIASSGRIMCTKENTLYECIDNTLLCLKDPRMASLQNPESLSDIRIRIDRFSPENRRILHSIDELDMAREGMIFLSQNLGCMSVILPHMLHVDPTPAAYFSLACQKAGVDEKSLTAEDYVIY